MPYSAHGASISGSTSNVTDGLPVILGNTFVLQSGGSVPIANAYVTGGRVWTSGLFANGTQVSVKLYDTPIGDYINPIHNRTPLIEKTATVGASAWTTALFDTPWKIPDYGVPWLMAYQFVTDATRIIINSDFRPGNDPYAADPSTGLFLSGLTGLKPGVAAYRHGWYRYSNAFTGFQTSGTTSYGIDTIVDIINPSTGPSWSVWNGSAEVPASAKVFNGTSEVDITTTVL